MKKKAVLMLMACAVMASLVACGGAEGAAQSGNAETNKKQEQKADGEELGTLIKRTCQSTEEEFNSQYYYVNLPTDYGYEYSCGIFAHTYAETDEYVILAQQYDSFTPVSSVEEVFPTYCSEVVEALDDNGHRNAANFYIGSTEMVQINNTEMCKNKGICTYYDENNEMGEEKFVAYSAPMSNGSYGFFILMGTDEAKVEADALYVATTFRETEEISEEVVDKLAAITPDSIENVSEGWGEVQAWETREVAAPQLASLVWEEVTARNGQTTKVATTPFNFTYEGLKEILAKHDIVAANYDLYDYNSVWTDSTAEDSCDMVYYEFEDKVMGMKKGSSFDEIYDWDCDFYVTMNRNTSDFTNCNGVSVTFRNLPETRENQEKVLALLTDIMGAELAEYLVYQNVDVQYEETFDYGDNAEYILTSSRGEYGMTFSAAIDIPLTRERLGERVAYHDGGYAPLTDTIKYNVSQVTGGLFDDFNILDFRNYEKDYMSMGDGVHVYAEPSFTYRVMQLNATDTEYISNLTLLAQKEDWRYIDCPMHKIDTEIVEDAEGIKKLYVTYNVENKWDDSVTFETVVDFHKEQIKALFPDADLSAATYDALKDDDVVIDLGTVTVMDKECQCKVYLDDSKAWGLSISYERE